MELSFRAGSSELTSSVIWKVEPDAGVDAAPHVDDKGGAITCSPSSNNLNSDFMTPHQTHSRRGRLILDYD